MAWWDYQPKAMPGYLGPLELVAAPTDRPLTTAEAKRWARIEQDEEDYLIGQLIDGATELAQQRIGGNRQIMAATYDLPMACFWGCSLLKLPRPPLQSVTSVKYRDTGDVEQTLAANTYLVRTPWRQPGTIELAPGQNWPTVQPERTYPITIRFVAGYASHAAVPVTLKRAIALIVAHGYRYRGDDDERGGTSALEIPPAALAMLEANEFGSIA
jgi:uncharacterized phiE125 gp8 family phage protein